MKRVLVVEPHPQVMAALADLVTQEPGCELVGAVATVIEALSLVSGISLNVVDAVLVDADTQHSQSHQLAALAELLPMAFLVHIFTATEPHKEYPEAPANTHSISILKTDVPEFLRSFTA